MPRYTYVVQDLLTGLVKDELPLRSARYTRRLNAPGEMSASIDRRHPKATRANIDPGRTAIYVMREGVCVWGGIIWTVRSNGDGLNIGAEGFWSYFRRRVLRKTLDYRVTGIDPVVLSRNLVQLAQADMSSDIGVTVGLETSGRSVKRVWYGYERRFIGAIVDALADNAISFDFDIECTYNQYNNVFSKAFQLSAPHRGSRNAVTWEVGVHCKLEEYLVDATKMENQIHGIGAGEADSMLIGVAADTTTALVYPVLENVLSYKDLDDPAQLDAVIRARLAQKSIPLATPNVTLYPSPETTPGAFITGDEVHVMGGDGYTAFNTSLRILAYTVMVSDEGDERTKVEFVDQNSLSINAQSLA